MKPSTRTTSPSVNLAFQFILLMGIVSALGDITYETGRSVSGPYLAFLGASAVSIGIVSGLGEFLGYALRIVSGYLASRTRAYWFATFIGYGMILCIPLLAYAKHWEIAALFLILERIGKAIRSPARDTMLSHATYQVGRGWGFAIHEALDQVGAVLGPLIFAVVFAQRSSYSDGFTMLWIPAVLVLVALFGAHWLVPSPEALENGPAVQEKTSPASQENKLSSTFWIYVLFTFLCVAGFANFQIISYHFVAHKVFSVEQIPLLYAVAMAVDALAALAIGKAYDKIGLRSLAGVPLLTLAVPFLAFSIQQGIAIGSAVLWGIVMAVHETIMRAAIADLIPSERRAFAYGIFNTIYGGAWFVSGAALGYLYDISATLSITYVVAAEILALIAYFMLHQAMHKKTLPAS